MSETTTGRGLDALVAKKAMGLMVRLADGRLWAEDEQCAMPRGEPYTLTLDPRCPEDNAECRAAWTFTRRLPRYSTDPGAAWEVVEAMRAKGWLVVIKAQAPGHCFIIPDAPSEYDAGEFARLVGAGKVVCEMKFMGERFRPDEFCISDTMPEAVCRAALAAFSAARDRKD
jgi:hypothetical protein